MAELADLLTGPTARHALAHRDITAVFRILRDAGVNQRHIARATGQRQSDVSEIISGRRAVQSIDLLRQIADGLGVPRGWMGLAYHRDLTPEPAVPDEEAATEEERGSALLLRAATLLYDKPVYKAAGPIRITHTTASEALLGAAMREPVRPRLLIALSDAHCGCGRRGRRRRAARPRPPALHPGHGLRAASDEPRPWKYFAVALPHVEGRTYLALGRFDRAAVAFTAAEGGASHTVGCSMDNFGHLAAAQLRCGELRSGLHTAQRAGERSSLGVGADQPRAPAGRRRGPARLGVPGGPLRRPAREWHSVL
ncbi:MAG: helix-turn-helix domain-containing protein [Pseudonocardiaceae bacterium]